MYEWGSKNNENFFSEGWRAVLPSVPTWCVYVTALRISWPSGVLEERSIGSVWFFSWASVIVSVDFSMAVLKKQCVCIEFFPFWGKQQQKPSQCFERLLKEKLWARQGFTNDFLSSNMVTCHLKTNRDLVVLQQAEPMKTFKKFAIR